MATLGERLREARESRGLTIEELAAKTRINARFFEAIERDDASALPSGFFYRSFVRQYARMLELPEEVYRGEIERSLAEESGKPYRPPERHIDVPPLPTARRNRKDEAVWWAARAGGLMATLAVCTAVYVGWERWKVWQQAPAAVEKAREMRAEQEAARPQTPAEQVQPATEARKLAPSAVAAASSGSVRVILRASDLSWVGVWQGRKFMFGDLMRAGEVRGFGADDVLRVKIGNAGAVSVEWNGQMLPSFGERGQVRTVEFRRDGYEVIRPPGRQETEEAPPNGRTP